MAEAHSEAMAARALVPDGPDPTAVLTTLLATGATLDEGATAMARMGIGTGAIVGAMLDCAPDDAVTMAAIAEFLWWGSAPPREAAAVLADRGIPSIRVIVASPGLSHAETAALAMALSSDMAEVRDVAESGREVVFERPVGAAFKGTFIWSSPDSDEPFSLRAWANGKVFTPRDVSFREGVIFDRYRGSPTGLTRLDRSMDAIRTPPDASEASICFAGAVNLERLPDTVEIAGPKGKLDLSGCACLTRLPERLTIGKGGALDLTGCTAWDGEIPLGAKFGKHVSVTLPSGRKVMADKLVRTAATVAETLPTGKGDLAKTARAMAKAAEASFPWALAELEVMGASHGTLTRILTEWLEVDKERGCEVDGERFLNKLDTAAEASPALALDALAAVRSLPGGHWNLDVKDQSSQWWQQTKTIAAILETFPHPIKGYHLSCVGLPKLRTLPPGTELSGTATLQNCAAFASLPTPLACKELIVRNCPAWDRVVPADANIRVIITDGHPGGINLGQWRSLYGTGPGR
jgi:hypothetical protein